MDLSRRLAVSEHSYSLEHYRVILRKAKDLGYRLPCVREVASSRPDGKFFVIRHDVDITPWAAETMAELETEESVTTTYYYRLHSPFYNLMDAKSLASLQRVAAMGHEVGLHYEPGFFLDQGRDPVEGTRQDIRTFEELVGFETHSIAQHQPAQGPLLEDISERHPCAYQRALVREIPYFGDSGFHWREGCICTKLGVHDQLHTLIHPHSWVVSDRGWQDVLRWHAGDLNGRLTAEMETYVAEVEEYLKNRARLDREREERYRGG